MSSLSQYRLYPLVHAPVFRSHVLLYTGTVGEGICVSPHVFSNFPDADHASAPSPTCSNVYSSARLSCTVVRLSARAPSCSCAVPCAHPFVHLHSYPPARTYAYLHATVGLYALTPAHTADCLPARRPARPLPPPIIPPICARLPPCKLVCMFADLCPSASVSSPIRFNTFPSPFALLPVSCRSCLPSRLLCR